MKTLFNQGWRFHYGEEKDADFMGWDDNAWQCVTLPHDWAPSFPFDRKHSSGTGYLPGGTGWYRKHFTLTAEEAGMFTRLDFEGVYKHARVWVNSYIASEHAYGYTSFSVDITPFIREGENVIAVRVEHEDVADSRWYTGSGIDRNVFLVQENQKGFVPGSVFARTEAVKDGIARIAIDYETVCAEHVQVTCGGACARQSGARGTIRLDIPAAHLWSPEDPFLYSLEAICMDDRGNVLGTETFRFGIRTFCFDADKGFFLNGVNRKIHGVCVHHDAGCLGAAVPKKVWAKRLSTLKSCGCDAIRTAHNPPDPDLLDLCDEMGFLVMDEAFDEWEGTKNKWWQGHNVYPPKHYGYAEDFPRWHREDLESMVRRDRNHCCIVLWSIGNEIDYPNDPYVTPLFEEVLGNNDAGKPAAERRYDSRKPDASRLPVIARELVGIVHSLDTTRPVTSALSFPELSNRTGLADELDLSGYNYREKFYEEDHEKYPGRVLLGSENSHDPAAWYAVADHDYISGQFLWTGVDFLGECKGWPVRISQAGLLNLAGYPKPLYAQRKALWTKEPFACLAAGNGDAERHGVWNDHFAWQGKEGEEKLVSCLTNQREAELFLNGVSLGKKTLTREDGCRAVWKVKYEPGELYVKAGGAEASLKTAGKAALLKVRKDAESYVQGDTAILDFELLDAQNVLCAGREEDITVQLVGDGELLGLENGKPDDLTAYCENHRETLDGKLIGYIRVNGPVTVYAWTRSGLEATIKL